MREVTDSMAAIVEAVVHAGVCRHAVMRRGAGVAVFAVPATEFTDRAAIP